MHAVRAVPRGSTVRASSDVLCTYATGTCVVEAKAFDDSGELVAQATGTFRLEVPAPLDHRPSLPARKNTQQEERDSRIAAEHAATTVKEALRSPVPVTDMSGWAAEGEDGR